MSLPSRLPGLRLVTVLWAVYAGAWISLEGALVQVVAMGVATTAVSLGHLVQRRWGGRQLTRPKWLLLATAVGTALGSGGVLLTLLFMVMKTGLHAHGPEFTPAEIAWVWQQLPLWTISGGLAGLGLGMAAAAVQ